MAKKGSSKRWLDEHFSDSYVKQAKQQGYRSRAAFKLLELQQQYHLFTPGMHIVDLGAAPGGWSQVLAKLVGSKGEVIAIDILPMEPIDGVTFIQGDFTDDQVFEEMKARVKGCDIDWVVSDMAPNISGNDSVDIPRSIYLAELALEFAKILLSEEGGLLVKLFQGEGFDEFVKQCRAEFKSVSVKKPKASRSRSREVYLLARKRKIN